MHRNFLLLIFLCLLMHFIFIAAIQHFKVLHELRDCVYSFYLKIAVLDSHDAVLSCCIPESTTITVSTMTKFPRAFPTTLFYKKICM